MADEPRHARVGDHARGEHGVGRRQQRADQERLRPVEVGQRVAATATSTQVIGIASTSLRSGSRHAVCSISASTSSPSRNRITISATTASSCTNPDAGSKLEHAEAAVAEHEPGDDEHRGQRQERAVREAETQRADHQQHAEHEQRRRRSHRRRVRIDRRGAADLRVTVLGKSPSWQDAGGACSGYLVQAADTTLLIDCGNGVFGKLRRHVDYVDVDAVVLSHLHADHFLDLVPYSYALTYAPRSSRSAPGRTDAPPSRGARAARRARGLPARRGAWGNDDLIELAFALREYDPRETIRSARCGVRFRHVPHFLPTYAIEVTARPGVRPSPTAPTARRPRTSSTSRATPICC